MVGITPAKISLETAKLLKEANFNAAVKGKYVQYESERVDEQDGTSGPFGWKKGETEFHDDCMINNDKELDHSNDSYTCYAGPAQVCVQEWLREEHNIHIYVRPSIDSPGIHVNYSYRMLCGNGKASYEKDFDSYDDAMENAIKTALLELKQK